MQHTHISLAHGNGGRFMRELINELFARHLANPLLNTRTDAAALPEHEGELMMTTDGFTVQPLEFPGGDIGALAIHGTVNDLAVSGADPLYLSLNAFIEEGLEIAQLERIIKSLATTAEHAGVKIVTGDTKVVRRGEGGGVYLATTGVGIKYLQQDLSMEHIRTGDRVLVSGPVGDHGTAVMLAREQFGMRGDLQSDAASVLPLTRPLREINGLRFMRDPTRGGLASVMQEIHQATGLGLRLLQEKIPVREPVTAVCEMLGYDPLFLACEGRVVAVVAEEDADKALALWQQLPEGANAALIGMITDPQQRVILETSLGGERILEELEDDPLPRIC
jgi:hydrogenase expression/formation protein HypE